VLRAIRTTTRCAAKARSSGFGSLSGPSFEVYNLYLKSSVH
jgi:hypothetical protein